MGQLSLSLSMQSVETGVLMTKCKHDRPFRCVAFNSANAAGDEVTGTASGLYFISPLCDIFTYIPCLTF